MLTNLLYEEEEYEEKNRYIILLNHYLRKQKGVKISVVGVPRIELAIEKVDLCALFSNLNQNVLEEVKSQGRGSASITIYISAKILVNRNEN